MKSRKSAEKTAQEAEMCTWQIASLAGCNRRIVPNCEILRSSSESKLTINLNLNHNY